MQSMRIFLCASLAILSVHGSRAHAQDVGATSEPDIVLRAEQNANAPVVATVKSGEPFNYECEAKAEWCKVTLRSGESGWLERAAIRYYFTEKDLPETDDPKNLSEIGAFARSRGFNYDATVRAAARGDTKALKRFFALSKDVDGAAAESHAGVPYLVYHLLGDAKFAAFLKAQPVEYWTMVRNSIASAANIAYLRRHFPETVKVLFRREIVDWPSPNGRYAIRKVFSDEFDLTDSKVVRAELIEKASGQVRCDMTADDIGFGPRSGGQCFVGAGLETVCLSVRLDEAVGREIFGHSAACAAEEANHGLPGRRRIVCQSRNAAERSARTIQSRQQCLGRLHRRFANVAHWQHGGCLRWWRRISSRKCVDVGVGQRRTRS
jgi:hypothetical protein